MRADTQPQLRFFPRPGARVDADARAVRAGRASFGSRPVACGVRRTRALAIKLLGQSTREPFPRGHLAVEIFELWRLIESELSQGEEG